MDEILPVSLGGDPLDFENTQPAHWICNARRGNTMPMPNAKRMGAAPKHLALPQPWDT